MNSVKAPPYASTILPMDQSWILCTANDSPLPESAPQSSVMLSDLHALPDQVIKSSHSVSKMVLQDKKNFFTVYFKKCDATYPPILAQIECAASASYRLVRGNQAAYIRPVVNHMGEVVGSISLEFPKLKPLYDCNLTQEDLLNCNIAESQVARYLRQEDDSHPGNLGLCVLQKPDGTDQICIVDLDFDMSFYTLTSQIKGARIINNGLFAPLPENAFQLTIRDFAIFPDIKDQQPCHWFTKFPSNNNWLKDWKQRELFQKLATNKTYGDQKWTAFLIESMITPEMHDNAMSVHFAKNAEAQMKRRELITLIEKRYKNLEALLVQSPGFRHFIVRNPDIFKKVEQKLSQNCSNYDHFAYVVKGKFYELVKKCMVNDMTSILFHIGIYLNKVKRPQESYHRLIHIVQQFHEDKEFFEKAFTELDIGFQMLGPIIGADPNKEMRHFFGQFKTLINNYRGFCDSRAQGAVSIYLKHTNDIVTDSPLGEINAPQVIAQEIIQWVSLQENILRTLEIVNECIKEYAPYDVKVNPRSFFRVRRNDLEVLITKIESMQKQPQNIVNELLVFFESGAWNQAGLLTGASANVLLIQKLANAALDDFKNMLSPLLLKNNELVQVCFLIQNDKWKIMEHAQSIAQEIKKLNETKK